MEIFEKLMKLDRRWVFLFLIIVCVVTYIIPFQRPVDHLIPERAVTGVVAPAVEHRGVVIRVRLGVVLPTARLLDVVAQDVDWPPLFIARFALEGTTRRAALAALRRTVFDIVALRFNEADVVCATGHGWEAQLVETVLPAANRTQLVEARLMLGVAWRLLG